MGENYDHTWSANEDQLQGEYVSEAFWPARTLAHFQQLMDATLKNKKHKHVNDELLLMCLSAQFRPHVFVTKSYLTDKDGSKPEDR